MSDFSRSDDQSSSPRTSPPSDEIGHMRSMSYDCYSTVQVDDCYSTANMDDCYSTVNVDDCYSSVKIDEQALVLSGYPMLTPLPPQTPPYTANERQLLSSSEDCDPSLASFSEHTMSNSSLSSLGGGGGGGIWPPTPESMVFREPVSMLHCIDYNNSSYYPQPWCEQVSPSIEYDFGSSLTDMVVAAPETWMMMPDTATACWTGEWEWWH